jgi:hypothetical protein
MQFLDIFYNVLFHPSQEFRVVSIGPVPKDRLLAYALVLVIVTSALGVIYSPMVFSTDGLMLKLILAATSGLIFWLFTAALIAMTAYIFGQRGRPQTVLILTAYATLPWLFLPVTMLFRDSFGSFGHTISVFASLGIWLWSAILFLMALKFAYSLTLDRILLVALLPILMTFLGLSWLCGFFFNLIQFLS